MDDEAKPESKIEEPIQLDDTNPVEIAKAPQSFAPQKGIAIALGAGVARGWSHIGVLRALDEADIPISMISGTSIGALVGGCYLAGKLDELEQFACSITKTSMLRFLDFTLSSNGLISGNRLADRMDEHIGHIKIEDLDRRFVAVATDIATGSEIWLNSGSLTQAIRASYALPGIFQPVMHYDRQLVDGALTNPIPVSACRAYEEQIVLAVKLDRDVLGRTAVVRSSSFPETLQGLDADAEAESATNKWLAFNLGMFGKKASTTKIGFTGVMIEAFNIIQDRIVRSRLAGDPPDFIIRPKIGDMGLTEFHRAQEAIDAGYKTTKEQIKVLEDTGFRSLLS